MLLKKMLKSCHPERGLIVAPKRDDQPQSKDPYTLHGISAAAGSSHEKLT
jgi:hypothetical protein